MQLVKELFAASKRNYTEIFEEKPQFEPFTGIINPDEERSGYIYDPVEVDVYLQIKSINEINLNEEYMDASIVITMEWIDKQLSWQTGEISATPSPSTTTPTTTSTTTSTISPQQTSTTENDTTQNSTETSQSSKEEAVRQERININSIRADKDQVWIPEIEILNRVNDFSPVDEKKRQLKVESNGKVRYSRSYRMRSMMSSSLGHYPYDVQEKFLLFNLLLKWSIT